MTNFTTILLLLISLACYCKTPAGKIVGKYSDYSTQLELKADSTFTLKTPDYVFPYNFTDYQTTGVWTAASRVVTLNPGKEKRRQQVYLIEKLMGNPDSIGIKINYYVEVYEKEVLIRKERADFNLLTLYINKPHHYINLVHSPIKRGAKCPGDAGSFSSQPYRARGQEY